MKKLEKQKLEKRLADDAQLSVQIGEWQVRYNITLGCHYIDHIPCRVGAMKNYGECVGGFSVFNSTVDIKCPHCKQAVIPKNIRTLCRLMNL